MLKTIVTLKADTSFEVEITGSEKAKTAVIMVHGFGVKRDSRGLFLDIENQIVENFLSVRADFTEVYDSYSRVIPISLQAKRLEKITQYIRDTYSIKTFIYIGHSQGGTVIAKAHPVGSQVILLAPPILSTAERFAQTPGWKKPGSSLNLEGESRLVRSDGSLTLVGAVFWRDLQELDVEDLYKKLNADNEMVIIFAGSDHVLGQEKAPRGIHSESIPSADHDFKGEPREHLVHRVKELIKISH